MTGSASCRTFTPEVIIAHAGGATIPGFDTIIMDGDKAMATVPTDHSFGRGSIGPIQERCR